MHCPVQASIQLDPSPAYIVNDYWDLIAWNRAAIKVFGHQVSLLPQQKAAATMKDCN